jgi:hypothetical protein
MCWCSLQVKTNDTESLYVEITSLRCIDIVSLEDYTSIMARECRIIVCKCLFKELEVEGSI